MNDTKKINVVVHDGDFHADDACAVAVIQLLLGQDAVEITRTRDESIITKADWVCDVGGIYEPTTHRFDHHQPGAPVRDNGVPYAAFGLVWKHYGERLCGDPDVSALIDERFIQSVDAADNGSHTFVSSPQHDSLTVCSLDSLVASFRPAWGDAESSDDRFMDAVAFVRGVLEREIAQAKRDIVALRIIEEACEKFSGATPVFDRPIPAELFPKDTPFKVAVMPYDVSTDSWKAQAVRLSPHTLKTHVQFPKTWAGLRGEKLQEASGVDGAIFCHRSLTMAFADSTEGALSLAAHAT
jgi:uncharacterized UPF0160 family protein